MTMIYFTFSGFSTLESAFSIGGLSDSFGDHEKVEYARFTIPKRKAEWVGSRLAVKRLVQACVPEIAEFPISQIQILKEPSGGPYIEIEGWGRLPGWLSLSHSQGFVLAAYSPEDISFGVDLEIIEPRSIQFVRDFFTEKEVQQALAGDADQNSMVTTIIWSAKEAVLKAISTGLRIDTRKIEINLIPGVTNAEEWNDLELSCPAIKIPSPRLMWRREGEFIQTLCVLGQHDQQLMWVRS
jgi:phosphopantetheinyl transferase